MSTYRMWHDKEQDKMKVYKKSIIINICIKESTGLNELQSR